MYSLPTLRRISRERLSSLILSPTTAPTIAIVDVRDADHFGGHISSSMHIPSSSLDYRIPELIRKLADKQIVVFHCALSQQRGPSAALRYLREKESSDLAGNTLDGNAAEGANADVDEEEKADAGKEDGVDQVGVEGKEQAKRETAVLKDAEPIPEPRNAKEQEVYVLDGGFVKWQEM